MARFLAYKASWEVVQNVDEQLRHSNQYLYLTQSKSNLFHGIECQLPMDELIYEMAFTNVRKPGNPDAMELFSWISTDGKEKILGSISEKEAV